MGVIQKHADAWTEFWRSQSEAGGCCSTAPEILVPISEHWASFAQPLPPGSRIIDLGCGAGAAARGLARANPSVQVTGIDFAFVKAACDPRIEILPGTRMESLPFPKGSFDAAVSQFGFEYGRVKEASLELARVLRPGSPISFLVHHSKARIALDSIGHRKALQAISGSTLEAAFLSGKTALLDRQLASIRHRFPHERIVEDAAAGLRRLIGEALAQRKEIWRGIQAALAPELLMMAELRRSAVSPEDMQSWLLPLIKLFDLRPPAVMSMAGGQLLCWKIEGTRKETLH